MPITTVLMLCAEMPDERGLGGVQLHTACLARHAPSDLRILTAHPSGGGLRVERWRPERRTTAILRLDEAPDPLARALEIVIVGEGVDTLHVHSPGLGPTPISRAIRRTGAACVLSLHDHSLVCENYTLLEQGLRYCEIPTNLSRCDRCLAVAFGRGPGAVQRHRAEMQQLTEVADAVLAPSTSVLEHARRVFPGIEKIARRTEWGVPPPSVKSRPTGRLPLRVAVVGVHAKVKGSTVLPALLRACDGLPVEWHFFGATEGRSLEPLQRAHPHIIDHGAYQRSQLGTALARARIDLVMLPSIVPESFSLTLSEVVAVGLPVVASRLGALEERVERDGLGWLFDPHNPAELFEVLSALCEDPERLSATADRLRSLPVRTEEDMAQMHAELYRSLTKKDRSRLDSTVARAELKAAARRIPRFERSRLVRAARHVRSSNWYRDLQLRRTIPEPVRKRLANAVWRWATRGRTS